MKTHTNQGPLERADQRFTRPGLIRREARMFSAAIESEKCCKCRAQATHRIGTDFYCALDLQWASNRAQHAKLRSRW